MDLTPFTPAGATAALAVTTSTARVALTRMPGSAADLTVIVLNDGVGTAFVKFGTVTTNAVVTDTPIPAGTSMVFATQNTDAPYLAAITATGSTTLKITSGTGLPYGYAAGGVGGGGGTSNVDLVRVGGAAIALGQTTMAASLPVVLASNQSTLPVNQANSSAGATTSVAGTTSATTLLALNSNRRGGSVYNDSSAILYVLLGTGTVSATVFTVMMQPGAYYEFPAKFSGIVTGIWASATGSARMTELT